MADPNVISQADYDRLSAQVRQGGQAAEEALKQLEGKRVAWDTSSSSGSSTSGSSSSSSSSTYSSGGSSSYGGSSFNSQPSTGTTGTTGTTSSSLGSMYKQIPGTNMYSTNPDNPNAARYYADGTPVPTINFDDNSTNTHFHGFGTPQEFQLLMAAANNPQAESNLISQWLKSGELNSNYGMPTTTGTTAAATAAGATSGGGSNFSAATLNSIAKVNDPAFLNQDPNTRLQAFSQDHNLAMAELNRVKSVYDQEKANGASPERLNQISAWANQVRQAAGISANDPFYGNGSAPTPDGTLHLQVNGQNKADIPVYQGTSYDTADKIAQALGVSYSRDPKTGMPIIGGKEFNAVTFDANGNPEVPTALVAQALGYNVSYDDKSKTVSITSGSNPKQSGTPDMGGNGQGGAPDMGAGFGNQPGTGLGGNTQDATAAWNNYFNSLNLQMPSLMPIQQQFTPDWQTYYNQAHAQIDPLYQTQYNNLMSKQASDIAAMDQKMNARGIFTSGIAQAAEDDLRAKTTNAVASLFNKQMSDIEKTAQTLYNNAYKQFSQGNQFALKYNQDQLNNYLNQQKQIFAQWIQTQKLNLSQLQYALNAWDKMATMLWNQYKFDNLSADQQAQLGWKQYTFDNLSAAQQAQLDQAWQKAMIPYTYGPTPYQQGQLNLGQQRIDLQQAAQQLQAYFKQLGYDLDVQKLQEAIRHNQATESLQSQKLSADIANNQQKFQEKYWYDQQMIAKANNQALDQAKQIQLSGLRDELTTIAQRINAFTSNNQQVPQTLIDNYNTVKKNIENVIGVSSDTTDSSSDGPNYLAGE